MRNVRSPQMQIGQTDIPDIIIDVTYRDDIPMILLGLQRIYTTKPLRKAVFKILEEVITLKTAKNSDELVAVDATKGRPDGSMEYFGIGYLTSWVKRRL